MLNMHRLGCYSSSTDVHVCSLLSANPTLFTIESSGQKNCIQNKGMRGFNTVSQQVTIITFYNYITHVTINN